MYTYMYIYTCIYNIVAYTVHHKVALYLSPHNLVNIVRIWFVQIIAGLKSHEYIRLAQSEGTHVHIFFLKAAHVHSLSLNVYKLALAS